MRWMLRRLVLVLCFGTAVLHTMATHADSRAEPTNLEARAHFDQGGKLFGLQEFEKAIDEYKQGAMIESLPVFDLALGQCYRMLHRYEDAIWYFDRFIKYGRPTGKLLKGLNDFIALMRAELDKQPTTQEPAEVPPIAVPEHKPAVSSVPSGRLAPSGSLVSTDPSVTATMADRRDPWYRDTIALGLAGGGTIAMGVASYLLWDAHRLHDESNTGPGQMRRAELHDQAGSRYQLGAAVGVGGVSVLVVAIIRLANHRSGNTRHASTSWNMGIARNEVMVFGQFW